MTRSNQGEQILWSELVKGELYGINIKEQEERRYHVYLHTLMDNAFICRQTLGGVGRPDWYILNVTDGMRFRTW